MFGHEHRCSMKFKVFKQIEQDSFLRFHGWLRSKDCYQLIDTKTSCVRWHSAVKYHSLEKMQCNIQTYLQLLNQNTVHGTMEGEVRESGVEDMLVKRWMFVHETPTEAPFIKDTFGSSAIAAGSGSPPVGSECSSETWAISLAFYNTYLTQTDLTTGSQTVTHLKF